uniref:ORF5 n=1 Tax=Rodentolepis nana TaxID=102285 RepID=A0A0R3TBN5_RODNA
MHIYNSPKVNYFYAQKFKTYVQVPSHTTVCLHCYLQWAFGYNQGTQNLNPIDRLIQWYFRTLK